MKIYTITHKEFIPPVDSLYVPLHVGHSRFTANMPDYGYMGDDTGDNISDKNHLYSELTGLYWIWKNGGNDDYAGLVHYRRYFADKQGKLMNEAGFRNVLKDCDIIIGEHIEYDVSYEEKFAQYHHREDLIKTGEVIKKLYPDYYETFLSVIHNNEQYVFNMMVTSKTYLDQYAKWLFDIFFELEKYIDVSGYDSYRARIYGFLSEELLYVWIKKNGLVYRELPVIYSQEKAETIEFKKNLKNMIGASGYEAAYEFFLKTFKERPDLTLEDSDFTQELRMILYVLEYAHNYPERLSNRLYFKEYFDKFNNIDDLITQLIGDDFDIEGKEDVYISGLWGVSKEELITVIRANAEFKSLEDKIINLFMSDSFKNDGVSCMVLYYDESQELNTTISSILSQTYNNLDVVVVDACGGAGKAMESLAAVAGTSDKDTLHNISAIRITDVSDRDFSSLAALKNSVITYGRYNKICFIDAGNVLESNDIENAMKKDYTVAADAFVSLARGGVSNTAFLIFDRRACETVSGYNEGLPTGEDYELALRICDGVYDNAGYGVIKTLEAKSLVYNETFEMYAYIIAKYAAKLREYGIFDEVFTARLNEAKSYNIDGTFVEEAEKYLPKDVDYLLLDKQTRPVLIIIGENLCRGILDRFAGSFKNALISCGWSAIIYDIRNDGINGLLKLSQREFRAVIGFQTEIFTIQLSDGNLAGNRFRCPKFQWTFDHPLYFSYHLMLPVDNYYLFSQDGNYARYVREYFPYVKGAWHVPPGGDYAGNVKIDDVWQRKKYKLSFVGAYNDYRSRFANIRGMNKDERKIALKLINYLKLHPDATIEYGLKNVLGELNKSDINKHDFVVLMHHMLEVGRLISFYFREKVIKAILDAEIELDVFSDLWKDSPFAENEHFHIHEDVSYENGLRVMQESRISLNVMSWHKDGMTERIANALLNGAVCFTDATTYIESNFKNGEDMVWFYLDRLDDMAYRLKELVGMSDDSLKEIAANGLRTAEEQHTWKSRAEQVMDIITCL